MMVPCDTVSVIQRRNGVLHFDELAGAAHFQLHVETRDLRDVHLHLGIAKLLEPCRFHCQLVFSRRKNLELVEPLRSVICSRKALVARFCSLTFEATTAPPEASRTSPNRPALWFAHEDAARSGMAKDSLNMTLAESGALWFA